MIVSITVAGEPAAPVAVTVIVSTYVPTVSALAARLHATVPLPVPAAAVSDVHAFFLVAVQPVVLALSPLSVIVALLPPALPPWTIETLRDVGLTTSVSGTGGCVTRSVSMTPSGEPDAPLAVIVSVST